MNMPLHIATMTETLKLNPAEAIQKLTFTDSQRIILSDVPYKKWNDNFYKDLIPDYKPFGMWYGIGDDWIQWCIANEPTWVGKYISEVTVNTDKILKISNEDEFDAFDSKFKEKKLLGGLELKKSLSKAFLNKMLGIDWPEVKKHYYGIEIAPYLFSKRFTHMWYYTWDIASGVIWDKSALIKRKTIYTFNSATGEYESV